MVPKQEGVNVPYLILLQLWPVTGDGLEAKRHHDP